MSAQDKSNFNNGNMEYELHLKKITKIKNLGKFNLEETTEKLAVISFDDIKISKGYISKYYYIC